MVSRSWLSFSFTSSNFLNSATALFKKWYREVGYLLSVTSSSFLNSETALFKKWYREVGFQLLPNAYCLSIISFEIKI